MRPFRVHQQNGETNTGDATTRSVDHKVDFPSCCCLQACNSRRQMTDVGSKI